MLSVIMCVQEYTVDARTFYALGIMCTGKFTPLYCFRELSELPGIANELIDQIINLSNLYVEKTPVPEYVTKAFEQDNLF